jgi:hypothetical protein
VTGVSPDLSDLMSLTNIFQFEFIFASKFKIQKTTVIVENSAIYL